MKDWQIAEAAEEEMKPVRQLADELGLKGDELLPMGLQLGKVDYMKVLNRLKDAPTAKYIDVTAITPTPLGEGKTTTGIGLIEGLGKLGKRVVGAIRQPSGGPTFNIKGSAAGGGLAQCIPLTPFSIRLTGDIDSITNAHNLAMVAVTSRMQHERNYDDARLAKSNLKRIDIDPERVQMKWVMDFCAQALHVTESGFGADIGFEKFWNLKCRMSGLTPNAVVIVATIRALKMHGGGPAVKPGVPLAEEYTKENLELVEKGCENLIAHIETVKKSGVRPVVCINSFYTDAKSEIELVRKISEQNGALAAVSEHWLKGGDGAIELAEAVIQACEEKNEFKFLYELDTPLRKRIELIAKEVYGAKGVTYTDEALEKAKAFEADPLAGELGTCMVKTHLSLSHDPDIKGRPKDWELPICDIMVYKGAGFIVPR